MTLILGVRVFKKVTEWPLNSFKVVTTYVSFDRHKLHLTVWRRQLQDGNSNYFCMSTPLLFKKCQQKHAIAFMACGSFKKSLWIKTGSQTWVCCWRVRGAVRLSEETYRKHAQHSERGKLLYEVRTIVSLLTYILLLKFHVSQLLISKYKEGSNWRWDRILFLMRCPNVFDMENQ